MRSSNDLTTKWIWVEINKIKPNPSNPRLIKDDKFKKLVESIRSFPEMLELRPVVVNADMMILGGNMRWKAAKEAGMKKISVIIGSNLTPEQQREFIIKDNVSGGEWDWEMLAQEWNADELEDWGLDTPKFAEDPDYSILDDEDLSDQLSDMAGGVKKSIQIEFEQEHYEEAYALVKFWRERNAYVGSMIMEHLKSEKDKL